MILFKKNKYDFEIPERKSPYASIWNKTVLITEYSSRNREYLSWNIIR